MLPIDLLSIGKSAMITGGDHNVHVQVDGKTFGGCYQVVGQMLQTTPANFGEASNSLEGRVPRVVAEQLLRTMASETMNRSGTPFVRDDGTVTSSGGETD